MFPNVSECLNHDRRRLIDSQEIQIDWVVGKSIEVYPDDQLKEIRWRQIAPFFKNRLCPAKAGGEGCGVNRESRDNIQQGPSCDKPLIRRWLFLCVRKSHRRSPLFKGPDFSLPEVERVVAGGRRDRHPPITYPREESPSSVSRKPFLTIACSDLCAFGTKDSLFTTLDVNRCFSHYRHALFVTTP